MKLRILAAATTFGVLLTAGTAQTPAEAAGVVTSGPGWTLTPGHVESLSPGTYTIKFNSTAAKDRLKGYFNWTVQNLNPHTPGVTFVVSEELGSLNTNGCQDYRTIIVTLEFRPMDEPGFSWGGSCYHTADHSLHSGLVRMDEEWWYPNWFNAGPAVTGWHIRNGVSHEIGHAIGLGHPNTDVDGDGTIEDHECVKNTDGTLPLMCSPNGGWMKSVENGKYTPLDVNGLTALVNNYGG